MSLDFTDDERSIFTYSNGHGEVYDDPLAVRRRLRYVMPNYPVLLRKIKVGQDVWREVDGRRIRDALLREQVATYARCGYYVALVQDQFLVMGRSGTLADFDEYEAAAKDVAERASKKEPVQYPVVVGGQSIADEAAAVEFASSPVPDHEPTDAEMNDVRFGCQADEKFTQGLADVFKMPLVDEKTGLGATKEMLIKVWNEYQEFMEKKSGTSPTAPTSSPPLASGSTSQ